MDNTKENSQKQPEIQVNKKPNENAGFYFSGSVKITDPVTGQVLVQMRAD
jgi:hypothetical protein